MFRSSSSTAYLLKKSGVPQGVLYQLQVLWSWNKLPTTATDKWKKRFILFYPHCDALLPHPAALLQFSFSPAGAPPSPASALPPSAASALPPDRPLLTSSREVATEVELVGSGARAPDEAAPCPGEAASRLPAPTRSGRACHSDDSKIWSRIKHFSEFQIHGGAAPRWSCA
jgi:hypothetical protein